jgi:hypothetical protein
MEKNRTNPQRVSNNRRHISRPVCHYYFTNLSGKSYTIAKATKRLVERQLGDP